MRLVEVSSALSNVLASSSYAEAALTIALSMYWRFLIPNSYLLFLLGTPNSYLLFPLEVALTIALRIALRMALRMALRKVFVKVFWTKLPWRKKRDLRATTTRRRVASKESNSYWRSRAHNLLNEE